MNTESVYKKPVTWAAIFAVTLPTIFMTLIQASYSMIVETAIGGCIGGGLLLTGTMQLLTGRPLWALGALSAGTVTVISNLLCQYRSREQN